MLEPGDTLGAYQILDHLRSGGMASLYLARRRGAAGFARPVAIKVVHPHLALDETFVRMFLDEAHLCSRIRHPNVVHVEELAEERGTYYLAMEYVEGGSLAQLLSELAKRERPLEASIAVRIAANIADALHAAHETRGDDGAPLEVVHRDVSPQNILLDRHGHVKLIDFGIARAQGRDVVTTTGTVKGKFRYMSPEQANAEPVDRRTDVFALGVVLWEMLAMRRLYDASSDAGVLTQLRDLEPPPPSAHHRGSIPAALDAVVLRALARDPDDRFPSAYELRRAMIAAMPEAASSDPMELASLVELALADTIAERQRASHPERHAATATRDAPRAALETPAQETIAHPPRARPPFALAIAGAAVLAIVIGVGTWRLWPQAESANVRAEPRRAALETAPAAFTHAPAPVRAATPIEETTRAPSAEPVTTDRPRARAHRARPPRRRTAPPARAWPACDLPIESSSELD
jgi:eukaryotic-like serine/threonine-protein kinase